MPGPRIRFDDYVFDAKARLLTRQGDVVHLTPKQFRLLELLISRRPAVVTKGDIIEHLWPRTYVSEGSLATLMRELREALDANGIPHVRTVHSVGYTFCADAAELLPPERAGRPPCRLVESGPEPRTVGLFEGDNLLGRGWECHVRIPSRTASREHALIRLAGSVATIHDLDSRHGTFVGKKKVGEPLTLSDGDRIRIGTIEMVFRVRAAAEEDTPPPPPKKRRRAA